MFTASRRGLLDFLTAGLCVWAAVWHTPVGALARGAVAKLSGSSSRARPLLAYFSGGVYDAHEVAMPAVEAGVPDDLPELELPLLTPSSALGHGVWVVLSRRERSPAVALARRYGLPAPDSPQQVTSLLERAREEFGSGDAAVLAVFTGPELARYAASRATAEGEAPVLEVLARQLPPGRRGDVEAASQALMLGTAYGLAWPVAPGTRVSSPFGFRTHPTLGREQLHTGVDLAVPQGTPVKVVADGVVLRASEDAVNGRVVIVGHGRGVSTAYCHNSRLLVVAGQAVRAGQVISESGNTGRSTGPHLHYQVELGRRPVDPFLFRGRKPVVLEPGASPSSSTQSSSPKSLKAAFDRVAVPPERSEVPP